MDQTEFYKRMKAMVDASEMAQGAENLGSAVTVTLDSSPQTRSPIWQSVNVRSWRWMSACSQACTAIPWPRGQLNVTWCTDGAAPWSVSAPHPLPPAPSTKSQYSSFETASFE